MSTSQRILAVTDLSAPASHAVERGLQLAQQYQAQLNVLHVRSQTMLHRQRRWLVVEADMAQQQMLVDAEHALQKMVAQSQSQFLVLGTHGEDFLQPWRLGSTTSGLLRKIKQCPVLVIKQTPA